MVINVYHVQLNNIMILLIKYVNIVAMVKYLIVMVYVHVHKILMKPQLIVYNVISQDILI
jgi:hypothetical protein